MKQDAVEAAAWYSKAAELGHAAAMYWLGLCYNNGKGVKQDKAEGYKWTILAAEQGDEDAKTELNDMNRDLSNLFSKKNYEEGKRRAEAWRLQHG
ncbi:MAG: hypothetical protein WCO56_01180 [Verrucomicrobiota bacterium]